MSKEYKRNPNTECCICSALIYRRPSEIKGGRVFCGRDCVTKAQSKETPCVVCKKPILAQFHKKTCSRSCANRNRSGLRYKVGSPKDRVVGQRALKTRLLEVRGKQCERCGYTKHQILHVHHRDRNRDNNELSNLELVCPTFHYEEHYLEKSWLGGTLPH